MISQTDKNAKSIRLVQIKPSSSKFSNSCNRIEAIYLNLLSSNKETQDKSDKDLLVILFIAKLQKCLNLKK